MFNLLKKENTTAKTFNYSLGKVKLGFTLRVDIKQELKDFLQCLESAEKEVKEELKNFK